MKHDKTANRKLLKKTVKQRWKIIYMMHKLIKCYIKNLKMKRKTDEMYRG